MPELFIVAGPNGAGKTTASFTILPQIFNCREFVNADEIARGLSPFNPESVAFEAGRIMLGRIEQLILSNQTFAFETTLSTRSYVKLIERCRKIGYTINLIFLWLNDPALAVERVRTRVAKGGHNIPEDVIRRRYEKGLNNFVNLFLPLCDRWIVADNSFDAPVSISRGNKTNIELIDQPELWAKILKYGN
ncbi:MAG: zeta toxin family protein [Chitinophagaceae bacterium]